MSVPYKVLTTIEPNLSLAHRVLREHRDKLIEKKDKSELGKMELNLTKKCITALNRWVDFCIVNTS